MRGTFAAGLALAAITSLAASQAAGQAYSSYGASADPQARSASVEALLRDPEAQRLLDADPALQRKLQQAYAKLAMANGDQYDPAVAHQQGIAAARDFAEIESTLRTRLEQARAAAEAIARREQEERQLASLRADADVLAAAARRLLKEPAPHDAPTLELRGELGRALQAYEKLGRDASIANLRAARDRLATAAGEVDAALRSASGADVGVHGAGSEVAAEAHPAPDKLRDAVAAFLAGRYAGAADILANAEVGDPQATEAAYMVRGAALFELYVESGEHDAALLARVRADVQACRRLDPAAVPSRELFSPRYAELFRQR
jgi:hypothetical protein